MKTEIRLGVVGTGPIVKSFIAACKAIPEIKIHAVYSRTKESGGMFAEAMGIPHLFTQYEDMLKGDLIDAVYIASPNACHYEHAKKALLYSKHVLCEKPFTSNIKELNLLIQLAKEKNLLMMEAMKSLAMPAYTILKDNLNKIGPVRKVLFNFCQYSSKYPAYLRGESPNIFSLKLSTGALMDIGVYCVYPCIDLFGMPKALKGTAHKLDNGIDGSGTLLLEYESHEAVLTYSKINSSTLGSEIMGEAGSLFVDFISSPKKVELRLNGREPVQLTKALEHEPMYYEAREFVDTILAEKHESQIYRYELAQNVMQMLDAMRSQIQLVFEADRSHSSSFQ